MVRLRAWWKGTSAAAMIPPIRQGQRLTRRSALKVPLRERHEEASGSRPSAGLPTLQRSARCREPTRATPTSRQKPMARLLPSHRRCLRHRSHRARGSRGSTGVREGSNARRSATRRGGGGLMAKLSDLKSIDEVIEEHREADPQFRQRWDKASFARAGAVATPPAPRLTTMTPGSWDSRRAGWTLLAVLGGAVLPVQGAINARLRADLNAPIVVAAVSFLLATAAIALVFALASYTARASHPQLRPSTTPWWGWLGGPIGAAYVTSAFLLIPRIGAASTVALTIAGQQLASVAVDQYGLLRLPHRRVTGRRLLGVGALLAGVALLQLT